MPQVSGQFPVGGVEERRSLLVVLADEQHERGVIVVREQRVPPPPAQEGVVAQELAVVLVDSPGAVVLDQVGAAATVSALDFQDGVGSYETRCGPSQAPDGAVVVETYLCPAGLSGGFEFGLTAQGE